MSAPYRILFVCMGNICRSPAGEGVMKKMVDDKGLSDEFEIDSAGTIGFHSGDRADVRMRRAALKRGYDLTSIARQVTVSDLDTFDLILTMDEENYEGVNRLTKDGGKASKIKNFCDFCKKFDDTEVPDPYYGGDKGFEHVLDLLEDGCGGILKSLQKSE